VRRAARVGAAVLAAFVAVPLWGTPAHASAYRYWSYWSWNGSAWAYSNRGPSAGVSPGETIGWRFAVQEDSSNAHAPRASGTSLCSDGVTVVIDYGTTADEPPNERPPQSQPRGFCATNPDDNTGYRATAEHATLRVRGDGLVCGIDGYPKEECAPIVSSPSKSSSPKPSTGNAPARTKVTTRHTRAAAPITSATALPTQTAIPHPLASGVTQEDPTPTPTATPTLVVSESAPGTKSGNSGFPVALVAGIAIAVALGGVALWRYRAGPR
jgi:hypothetical protein